MFPSEELYVRQRLSRMSSAQAEHLKVYFKIKKLKIITLLMVYQELHYASVEVNISIY